ncbi:MAG: hypothetical protein AB1806_05350 [Acidobacteriota bacterium]
MELRRRIRHALMAFALPAFGIWLAVAAILAGDAALRSRTRLNPKYSEWFFVENVNHFLEPNLPDWPPTNADGIRSRREAGDFPRGGNNIVFLGDSFVFGYNVRVDEALPAGVEALLNDRMPGADIRIANFGWISASPFVENRLFGRIAHRYHPKLVVLGLDMTDFHDDIKYELMHWRRGLYRFYDVFPVTLSVFRDHAPELFWKVHSWSLGNRLPRQKFFACEQPLEASRPLLAVTLENLRTIDRSAKLLGARFVLVVLPRAFQHSRTESPDNWEKDLYSVMGSYSREPFRYFAEAADRVDFPIYSLLPAFERATDFPLYARDDPHWTRTGTAVAARAVADILAFESGWGRDAQANGLAERVTRLRLPPAASN